MNLRAWLDSVCSLLAGTRAPRRSQARHVSPVTADVQTLEARELLASMTVDGGRLVLTGDLSNDSTVIQSGHQLTVRMLTERSLQVKTWDLQKTPIRSIEFVGGFLSNRFDNQTSLPSVAHGGAGPDVLLGGSGRDELEGGWGDDLIDGRGGDDIVTGSFGYDRLFGGTGFDTLVESLEGTKEISLVLRDDSLAGLERDTLTGFEAAHLTGNDQNNVLDAHDFSGNAVLLGGRGHDRLYGGRGADLLDGGAGRDGLFGDLGPDTLIGGAGADRFLIQGTEDILQDKVKEDAVVRFNNVSQEWSGDEIRTIDDGLAWLHESARSTRLLKTSSGGAIRFERHDSLGRNGDVLGVNRGRGVMQISDAAAASSRELVGTAIHEIGHNWDTEEFNPRWKEFLAISRWQELPVNRAVARGFVRARSFSGAAQPWIYAQDAGFAQKDGYGRTNPYEDFASTLEAAYRISNESANPRGIHPVGVWAAKYTYVLEFVTQHG